MKFSTAAHISNTRSIPFFDYPGIFAEHADEYMAALRDALSRGAFIMQSDLEHFERELAELVGAPYALGVADGTMGLVLALKVAGIGEGDEVIVPSHTFIATAAAVHHVGATPVLCDCGADHMIDIESARRMVTAKTRAIMPVQLNGRTCDMEGIQALADEFGIKVVEDSCQALGATFNGRPAGSFGVAGTFSFFPAKTLGCFGDGGAMIFQDEFAWELAREYRDHGRAKDGLIHRFGHNARLDNVQAAVLRLKLKYYKQWISHRRHLATIYDERLRGLDSLLLPPPPGSDPRRFDIFQNYEVEADQREPLREYLAANGVGTIIQWGGHVIHQFKDLGLRADAPYAERMSSRYLLLPMHHLLAADDVHYVCDLIEAFYRDAGA